VTSASSATVAIRDYRSGDESSWLHCRLLSFFGTCYYDDVKIARTGFDGTSIELVAEDETGIVGILDLEVDGRGATIDTVAVLPDAQGRGIASRLLDAAMPRLLASGVTTLDAWTREDAAAIGWYTARGFVESFSYLHVYRQEGDPIDGFASPEPLSRPVIAFTHAPREREVEMRETYQRIYVCRQMVRVL
jgi:ribosomal protein S18 acetylase RimI-like enzyme